MNIAILPLSTLRPKRWYPISVKTHTARYPPARMLFVVKSCMSFSRSFKTIKNDLLGWKRSCSFVGYEQEYLPRRKKAVCHELPHC